MSKKNLLIFQRKAHSHEHNVVDGGLSNDSDEKKSCELEDCAYTNGVFCKTYGKKLFVKYNIFRNMKWIILICIFSGSISSIPTAFAETDYFPGEFLFDDNTCHDINCVGAIFFFIVFN